MAPEVLARWDLVPSAQGKLSQLLGLINLECWVGLGRAGDLHIGRQLLAYSPPLLHTPLQLPSPGLRGAGPDLARE